MTFKETYIDLVEDLQPSEELTDRILKRAEVRTMKKFNKKKMVILVAAACMMLGTTAFAAGHIASYRSWSSNLSSEKDIAKSRADAEKLGVSLAVPEAFSNGYTFSYSNSGGIEALDENGNSIDNGKTFMATYTKDGCADAYLNVDPSFEPFGVDMGEKYQVKDICGTSVYFYSDTYKFVPSDYELTDEDKENMERPDYEISYGSDEVTIQNCSGFIFEYDSKTYNMLSFDSGLTNDEWAEMVEELISQ